jgi:NADH-quinone oxidoreductase subunit L
MLAVVIFLLPISTFLLLLFFGHKLKLADWYATAVMALCFGISIYIFKSIWWGNAAHARVDWVCLSPIANGTLPIKLTLGVSIDKIAALMLVVVTFISTLVHVYSQEYMKGDKQYVRYFAYLNTFTASMLGIVVSDNLFAIFVFWELVGLTSYLLIGFWYQKNSAIRASKKAFLINRIGDLGFLVGLMIIWSQFGTLDLEALRHLFNSSSVIDGQWIIQYHANHILVTKSISTIWITVAGIGVFCGCIGKSAQFPLQIWLPDAMEGPTPVSALIHAATMVAAGVFLLARVFFMLDVNASTFITIIGCTSAFAGAYAAISQYDIKKILAYSTISQLGYMVMGMGVGAYNASLFHLITHAFFKAGLFLCAGAVIHVMHHVQHQLAHQGAAIDFDTQNVHLMGGLRKAMPITFLFYLVLSVSAMGLPLSSGFLSKDAILLGVWAWAEVMSQHGNVLYYIVPIAAFLTALITAFYMGRQLFLVFLGEFRLEKVYSEAKGAMKHIHDPGWKMLLPLMLLALLSLGVVFSPNPFAAGDAWLMKALVTPTKFFAIDHVHFQNQLHLASEHHHTSALLWSILVASVGLFLSYLKYGRKDANKLSDVGLHPYGIVQKLSTNNFYLDRFYQRVGVTSLVWIANVVSWIDQKIIDRAVNLFAVAHVVFANIVSWFDMAVVDGSVGALVYLSARIGGITRSFQTGKIQSYFAFVIGSLLLFVILVLIN